MLILYASPLQTEDQTRPDQSSTWTVISPPLTNSQYMWQGSRDQNIARVMLNTIWGARNNDGETMAQNVQY
jgi:hypothetical protein